MGVSNFGLSVTTLEDVFLKVGAEVDKKSEEEEEEDLEEQELGKIALKKEDLVNSLKTTHLKTDLLKFIQQILEIVKLKIFKYRKFL